MAPRSSRDVDRLWRSQCRRTGSRSATLRWSWWVCDRGIGSDELEAFDTSAGIKERRRRVGCRCL